MKREIRFKEEKERERKERKRNGIKIARQR